MAAAGSAPHPGSWGTGGRVPRLVLPGDAKKTRLEPATAGPGTRLLSSDADEPRWAFPPVYTSPLQKNGTRYMSLRFRLQGLSPCRWGPPEAWSS